GPRPVRGAGPAGARRVRVSGLSVCLSRGASAAGSARVESLGAAESLDAERMNPGPKAPPTLRALPLLGSLMQPSERVVRFFRYYLTHVKGRVGGQPLTLAASEV